MASAAVFVVKCFLFVFDRSLPLEHATLILAFVSCAAEIVVWTCLFPASIFTPLSRKKHKPKPKKAKKATSAEQKSINHVAKDYGENRENGENGEKEPLLFSGSETGFDTPDELSDTEPEVVTFQPGLHVLPAAPGKALVDAKVYTEQELEILEVLRPRFPKFRDDKLYKFMVARQMNLPKIIEMLDNHVQWREKHGMDTMDLSVSPQPLRGFLCYKDTNGEDGDPDINTIFKLNGCCVHRFGKNGQPLVIFRPVLSFVCFAFHFVNFSFSLFPFLFSFFIQGYSDAKGVVKHSNLVTIERTMVVVAEMTLAVLAAESERNLGQPISKISVIVDLSNLGTKQLYLPAISFFTTMIQLLEAHYP